MAALSVGQVARRAGVGVEPVRFYERQGLLAEPARKASGYRQYGDEAVAALRFIRRAKLLGFTLKEIKGLLALRLDGGATRSAVREQATAKMPTSRTRSATSAHADRPQGVDCRLPRQRPGRRLPHPRRPERPGRRGTAHPGRGGVTITETRCKTNLNCRSCVAAVAPHLNGEGRIRRWSVDARNRDKVLTVEGDGVGADAVGRLVAAAGFRVLGEVAPPKDLSANGTATAEWSPPPTAPAGPRTSYYPIALLFGFLVLGTGLLEIAAGAFEWPRAMARFMGGFFLAFAFFKLLDVRAFADAYAGYDVVAARWRWYWFAYPYVELLLGAAYLAGVAPVATSAVTLAVMAVGTVGVVRALVGRKKIRCACLGAVFNLPMSYVTLAEDVLMAGMAAAMLLAGGHP